MEENNNESTFTIAKAWKTIKKNFLWIVLATVIAVVIGLLAVFVIIKPKYESRSSIAVTAQKNGETEEGLNYSDNLRITQTISELVKEDIVLNRVAEQLGKKDNIQYIDRLKDNINVEYSSSSFIIVIKVHSHDPNESQMLANYITQSLIYVCNNDPGLSKLLKNSITQTTPAQKGIYYSPDRVMVLAISLVAGLAVGIAIVFIKEAILNVYQTKEEVQQSLHYNIIGSFHVSKDEVGEYHLKDPKKSNFEAFNKLLYNVKYLTIKEGCKVIMITSTVQGELKTTTISNLAQAIALNDKKVLLIDLDLRRPRINKVFSESNTDGIVDYIDGTKKLDEIIKRSIANIDIITTGKAVPNPLILIESNKMNEAIEELKKKYDYILLDTPPLTICTDALVISKMTDGVIFNIGMRKAKKSEIAESLQTLNNINANILGLCLTLLDYSKREDYYYSGYNNEENSKNKKRKKR